MRTPCSSSPARWCCSTSRRSASPRCSTGARRSTSPTGWTSPTTRRPPCSVRVCPTVSRWDYQQARERGRDAVDSGVDTVVVVGGDGMVHLGVNLCAGTSTRLAVVGAGTGNDFARNLGLPVRDARASVALLSDGRTRRIDLGRVSDGVVGESWFGGVLGAGFDAVVNARAQRMRWPHEQMRYNLAVLRELPVFRPIPYAIELDGRRIETS